MGNIAYLYKDNLYLNITNKCCVRCSYCIKYRWNKLFRGYNLGLNGEPTVEEVKKELKRFLNSNVKIKEIVFCGYGEPLLRYNVVKEISLWVKNKFPQYKIRVNTNGLASAYTKVNICKELSGIIDSICISLNAHNEEVYLRLHKTSIKHPFRAIINFIKQAIKYIPVVTVTAIKHPLVDIAKVKKITEKLGVRFRTRRYLTSYESR
ncbi:MAG: TatD family nuclease-associated radical SAM protein [Endomicrobia bacterium]|nr:TatD family nuclease-associated radical SAM protein [Endomicrobiia bacterium]MDW8056166.1 TatD family nuclease-associated radical SAM protein [Elusimicrobiota bacterium]